MKTTPVSPARDVLSCVNLRRQSPTGRSLEPVGHPAVFGDGDEKPIYRGVSPDHRKVILSITVEGRLVMRLDDKRYDVDTLSGEPSSVMAHRDRLLLVYPGRVASLSLASGDAASVGELPELSSPLSLAAEDAPVISTMTQAIELGGVYTSRAAVLSTSDRRLVSSALVEAYHRLDVMAAGERVYLQPVLGRYRLLDNDGRELYSSAPVVLGPGCGVNFMEPVEGTMMGTGTQGAYGGIAPMRVTATPFRPVLRLDCAPDDAAAMALLKAAARIEVLLSPQLHPLDSGMVSGCVMHHGSNQASVSTFMPGVAVGTALRSDMLAPVVMTLLARIDRALEVEATLAGMEWTVASAGGPVAVERRSSRSVAQEQSRLAAIGRLPTDFNARTPPSRLQSLAEAPHRFSGATVAVSGGTVLWGDITTHMFKGYSPCEMAREAEAAAGSSRVQVIMPEGTVVNRVSSKSPATLSPLVCYPSSAALMMRMLTRLPDGRYSYLSFPLTTVAGCRYAFWLNPSLKPVVVASVGEIHESAIIFPDDSATTRSFPGGVITSDIMSPLTPRGVSEVSSSAIKGISAVIRDVGGWNFSRTRFYLFTTSGVMKVGVGSDFKIDAPVLLSRGASSGKFVAAGDKMLAVIGGALVSLSGARPRVEIPSGVTEVGFSGSRQEVWVKVGGSVRVYDKELEEYYIRDIYDAGGFVTLDDTLYISRPGGRYYDTSVELPAEVAVMWRARVEVPPRHRLVDFRAMMQASSFDGAITVTADGGAGAGHDLQVTSWTISGAVNYPVTGLVAAPCRPYLNVEINGRVSSDFTLSEISLNTCRHDTSRAHK